ncbi:MAG: aldehyde dehydrogenase family protein [Gammaproteobacteria bacterium]|nr:aldehyde dehydrogenase family protein [Gammaproteobacteria bacterium]
MPDILKIRNPRSGEFDYEISVTTSAEIAPLAEELRDAQTSWLRAGVDHRTEVLQRWKNEITVASDEILDALSADTGRRAIARGEIFGVCGMIDNWCQLAPTLVAGDERPSSHLPDVALRRQLDPYPLLGVISPWNFPFLLSFIDAIPALVAGCAAIIKPSEVTPRFAAAVAATIRNVPELHAVLRFISGDGRAGASLIEHVDVVAFTGSVATGRKVAAAAAEAFIPAFLELGGKDPAVILPGSDLERASTSILRASIAATGQACQSLERIYVHKDQHDEFVELLAEKAEAAKLSFPDPDQGIVGPLIFDRQAEIIADHIEDAVAKGATIRTGGKVLDHGGGRWIEPTILTDVNHSMKVMTEETFGPVMPVMAYETTDAARRLANDTEFGLSGAVFAATEAEAIAFAEQLDAGGISINDAGMTTMTFEACKQAFKMSGMGPSRMGPTGLTRFFREKALYLNRGPVTPIETQAEGQ